MLYRRSDGFLSANEEYGMAMGRRTVGAGEKRFSKKISIGAVFKR